MRTSRGDFRFRLKTKNSYSRRAKICAGVWRGLKGDPKRVRLEGESRASKPRRQRADLRFLNARFPKNGTPRSRVTFHVRISPSSMVPKKSPRNDQNLQRRRPPREDQVQDAGDSFSFSFRKPDVFNFFSLLCKPRLSPEKRGKPEETVPPIVGSAEDGIGLRFRFRFPLPPFFLFEFIFILGVFFPRRGESTNARSVGRLSSPTLFLGSTLEQVPVLSQPEV
ncbi:hypothetical protein GEV33_009229 [Tenebrio molitor]|uniref:Uncharacterized protein n=1 Tax=Tenebrio molitor TaxID=7067 RepID=A0A8J6LAV9_TENMO|nr:hypothetical protein GEV33_009229 [Tenebrio molitor]